MWLLTDITEQSIRQCSVLSEFSCNASDEFTFRLKLIVSPPASNMFGKRPIVDKLSAGGSWMDWIPCLQIQEFYFHLCSFSKALLTLQFEWENSCNLKDLCNITSWWTIVKLAFLRVTYVCLCLYLCFFILDFFTFLFSQHSNYIGNCLELGLQNKDVAQLHAASFLNWDICKCTITILFCMKMHHIVSCLHLVLAFLLCFLHRINL